MAALLPFSAYAGVLFHLNDENHQLRLVRDCLLKIQAGQGEGRAQGLFVYVPDPVMPHSIYYYFRQVRPWTRMAAWDPPEVVRMLDGPALRRPALIWGLNDSAGAPGMEGGEAGEDKPGTEPPP